jgi:glycosyltransferase involved in cell wall biosynthesis
VHNADILMVTGPTLTGCIAARQIRSRCRYLAVHYHHGESLPERLKWRLFYDAFADDYDRIIFPTRFLRNEAERIAPKLIGRTEIVPCTIDQLHLINEQEKIAAKESFGIPHDAVLIGNAGWLISRKRFDVFLSVAARITERINNCYFVIAGDGLLKDSLIRQAKDSGIAHRVKFIGWQSSLHQFYSALDLLLFNSDADAFGRTPMEAMSYGVPVVASATYGGTNEIVLHEITGFLLREHDVEALTKYAVQVITDEDLRCRLVEGAIEHLRLNYTIEAATTRLMRLFAEKS